MLTRSWWERRVPPELQNPNAYRAIREAQREGYVIHRMTTDDDIRNGDPITQLQARFLPDRDLPRRPARLPSPHLPRVDRDAPGQTTLLDRPIAADREAALPTPNQQVESQDQPRLDPRAQLPSPLQRATIRTRPLRDRRSASPPLNQRTTFRARPLFDIDAPVQTSNERGSPVPNRRTTRSQTSNEQGDSAFQDRPFIDRQVALNLAQFAQADPDLNLSSNSVENLVNQLTADAPQDVTAAMANTDATNANAEVDAFSAVRPSESEREALRRIILRAQRQLGASNEQ